MIMVSRTFATAGLVMSALVALTVISGCKEKKMEPVPVGEMVAYRDPGIGFSISHPEGWAANVEVGKARFYNSPDVAAKFVDPTSVAPIGVEISVDAFRTPDPAARMKQIKDDMANAGIKVEADEAVTVGNASGTKFRYTANYGGNNIIHGHQVMIPGDSMLFELGFAGFGDFYNAYAGVFDASLKSFVLPKPKEKGRDETLPSDVMAQFDSKMFTFQYPDNFNSTNPAKGKFEEVIELRGARLDCSIRFDVFGAKGLTVDKVFDQNKGSYKAKSTGKAMIGGEQALFVNYSLRSDVESRAYFVVKNDKVVRVSMNWYKPQTENYLPVYEAVINSIRFK